MSWWTELFGCCTEDGERPGGIALTDHAVQLCGFSAKDTLVDVACGNGATMAHLRETLGCTISGIDSDPARQGDGIVCGRAQSLPFPDASVDGVLIECGLSQMDHPEQVFAECLRILVPGGRMIVSDLYARKGGSCPKGPLGRLDSREQIEARMAEQGLTLQTFEDHSDILLQLWANALMSGTGERLYQTMRSDPAMQGIKCGYYLCTAKK